MIQNEKNFILNIKLKLNINLGSVLVGGNFYSWKGSDLREKKFGWRGKKVRLIRGGYFIVVGKFNK